MAKKTKPPVKISLQEYATKHNPYKNRRGQPMSVSYLYRLIREDISGKSKRKLWFQYTLEGEKDHIFILLDAPAAKKVKQLQ